MVKRSAGHVLIVDDEESICWGLTRLLTEEGHGVSVASSAEEAFDAVTRRRPDLVVLDVRLPGMDGLSAMQRLDSLSGRVPIVVITAFGNLATAVRALKNGAIDYLTKPFDLEQVAEVIRRALERAGGETPPADAAAAIRQPADELLGSSPAMQEVFKQIALVAATDVSVLITGESGTGKELVARAIHRHSARAEQPFLPINLAALSATLVESELFGHVRGAFTGAEASRTGLLEIADGATVFFDEAGDIPPNVQVKLLRVLEQGEVTPVGDTRARRTNFRVIAATHHELHKSPQDGGFRQDLFFRLAGFEIHLPPLRKHPEDIPLLATRFLESAPLAGSARLRFTDAAMAELVRRPWPGNVRELRTAVEHGALVARGGPIGPEHLPAPRPLESQAAADPGAELVRAVRSWAAAQVQNGEVSDLYKRFLAEAEPPLVETILENTLQNRVAAAEMLGIHRATLRKKLT